MATSVSRRQFLRRTAAMAAGSAGLAALPASAAEPPPAAGQARHNVLLITIDALRADHLGCYGYRRDTSPTIDSFAKEALRFEHTIVQGTWTLPSMASMLTGQYVAHHGVEYAARRFTGAHLTAARLFKSAGFTTVGIVEQAFLTRNFGFDLGFDRFVESGTRGVTGHARKWLEEQDGSPSRFFMWLHYLDPHSPYDPPESYRSLFSSRDPAPALRRRLPLSRAIHAYDKVPLGTLPNGRSTHDNVSPYDVGYYIDQYDAEIRYADGELKDLFAVLRRLGLWDRTILLITADHGECLGEHGIYFDHGLPWDADVRIPLLMRVPGLSVAGQAVESQVRAIDILPTLLDLVGLKSLATALEEGHFDGESFVACLEGRPIADRAAFGEQGITQTSYVRTPPWKYIEMKPISNWPAIEEFNRDFFRGRDEIRELFNIQDDPGETKNLIEADPKKAHELRVELFKHKAAMAKKKIQPGRSVIDEKTKERLRALGYIQ